MLRSLAGILIPPPNLPPDEWADTRRILPAQNAIPGRWRTALTPYARAPMRAFAHPSARIVVFVAGSQMGKTELELNVMGWRLDLRPVPVLYVGPTRKQVTSVADERVRAMVESTPTLAERLERGQRDRMLEKFFAGTRLGFAWAGSATELASHPAGLVLVDERDRMESDVAGEGDPVELSRARTFTYPHGKVGVVGTWTIDGASPTQTLFEAGSMHRWGWHCLGCGEWFVPRRALLHYDESSADAARRSAVVACPGCGYAHETRHRAALNAGGEYRPHRLNDDGELEVTDEPAAPLVLSYWVSGLASPFRAFGELAADLVLARSSGEPEREQAVVNTGFGELYTLEGEAPPWESVLELRQPYPPGLAPAGVQIVTAGVDVQKRGLYYVVRGWGFLAESWLLKHGFIAGDTEYDGVWILLSRVLSAPIPRAGGGRDLQVERVFIDSGWRPGDEVRRDHQVYLYARRYPGIVYPSKGHATQDIPVRSRPVDVSLAGRTIKGGTTLWHLDSDYLKTWIYGRLAWPEGESGGFHLHAETDEDYCRQLVAEQVVIDPRTGKRRWLNPSRHNHYLDAEACAYAAAHSRKVHDLSPLEDGDGARPAPPREPGEARPRAVPPPPTGRPFVDVAPGAFFRR